MATECIGGWGSLMATFCWADLFHNEDVVKYASVCWPRASTHRWYTVINAERLLTTPPLVASSDCSRCSQTLVCVPQGHVCEQGEGHIERNKAHGHARELERHVGGWQLEMMANFNVLAFHFGMHVLLRSRGPADHAFNWVCVPIDTVCCC